jgi:MFS family permease
MKELLRDRDTRFLLTGQWIAQAADGLVQAVFANVLILEPEGTPLRFLGVAALTLLPYSLIAPFLGVFVDRWSRRRLLVGTNIARAILLLALAAVYANLPNDLFLYIALLSLLGIGRLFLTTKGAVLPVVLHERHLLQGNSLSGGGGMIAALAGGVAGIASVAVISTGGSLVVAAAAYVASSLTVARISQPLSHATELEDGPRFTDAVLRVLRDLKAGYGAVTSRPAALLPLIGIFFVRTAAMIATIGAIIVIKENFPDAGDEVGRLSSSALAIGSAGVGAFVGAVSAPSLGRKWHEPQLMLLGFAVSGLGIVALGGIASIPAVLGLTLVGGFGAFVAKVSVDAQVQRALPDDYRGRGFALYDILFNFATVTAALLTVAGEPLPLRWFLVLVGAGALVAAAYLGSAMNRAGLLQPH